MRQYAPLILLAGASAAGGIAYAVALRKSTPPTALACAIVWIGMGALSALAFRLGRKSSLRGILYASLVKVWGTLILVGAVAFLLKPNFEPFLLCSILAILLIQGAYVLFSL
ncbi:MAG: hypothetical protein NZ989_06965 [Bacteroidia bacterium]|nr:hypothetical protein [Bacteroidia bacterium]MDW8058014.1 hypothetical protein [Bacteroidia bacterium]